MSLLTIKILFFCLIPIGMLILSKGIKLLKKPLNGKVILSLHYSDKVGNFTIEKTGIYSIWQKGDLLKKTPINKFRPHLYDAATNKELILKPSIMSPRSNNFSTGQMEMFTFTAKAGNYELKLLSGSSVSKLQSVVGSAIPLANIDPKNYFIEVRESQSQLLTLLSIPMMLLGLAGVIGGPVMGLLAEQLFI